MSSVEAAEAEVWNADGDCLWTLEHPHWVLAVRSMRGHSIWANLGIDFYVI